MRIFDNPNHEHYGPVRRLWIMLAQLDLLDTAERRPTVAPWDETLSRWLSNGLGEAPAQRAMLDYLISEF